jgi:hypothetical protein
MRVRTGIRGIVGDGPDESLGHDKRSARMPSANRGHLLSRWWPGFTSRPTIVRRRLLAKMKAPHAGLAFAQLFQAAATLRRGRRSFLNQGLYRELQFLGGAKCHLLAGFDLDRFAGRRIPAHASWPLPDLQDAKTSNPNSFTLLKVLGDVTDKLVEQGLSLPFCQLMLLGQAGRKMLECDWTSSRFRLSCHGFEPFIERERSKA